MRDTIRLSFSGKKLEGRIRLDGSKSISNRVLLINALLKGAIDIGGLSTSDDTQRLKSFLGEGNSKVKDAGPAGTTFRFSTAYYAIQPGEQILTGSDRMKQRPIGALVDALRSLGADISYLEREGFPPLKIGSPSLGNSSYLEIPASTSSQFVTALLLIAPHLPQGLRLKLVGDIVSRSYIELTIAVMRYFGAAVEWVGSEIRVAASPYEARSFRVEADWSAASYFYAMAVFADEVDLFLEGLFEDSQQGDRAIVRMMEKFGVVSYFESSGVRIVKEAGRGIDVDLFEQDFLLCPDIAQTLAVICAGTNTKGVFTGLQTLSIKETDRIAALNNELSKVGVHFSKLPESFSPKRKEQYYLVDGQIAVREDPTFSTYHDHRMAMAFAPLALLGAIRIEDPMVVVKSYPDFWNDLSAIGFDVEKLS